MNNIENLVICSTLNQITNYLMIMKFKPKNIYNITFFDDAKGKFNLNIKPNQWDKYLIKIIKEKGYNLISIPLSEQDLLDSRKIKKEISNNILNKTNKEIFWHITGGQRTIALAISNLLLEKERKNDKILYIEGNSEKLIINDYKGDLNREISNNYFCNELVIEDAFELVGFETKDLKSTVIFKGKNSLSPDKEIENKFYLELYEKLAKDVEVRDVLIKSNHIESNKRLESIKNCFNTINFTCKDYYENKTDKVDEFNKCFPAGYIFEKIMAFKIYDKIKDNPKIVDMRTSVKTYFDKKTNVNEESGIIDELDIVILTNTGKIINFECKSGGMSGDNAKSHNYTTYRLNGVFGMPILLSPLYKDEKEDKINKDFLDSAFEAYRSAKRAELKTICIDEIQNEIKKLLEVL